MRKSNYMSLTDGKLLPVLIRFSIPFILSSLLQMLYSSVDVYFMGHFASTASVSGAYSGVGLIGTITYIFFGIATGGTILLGQHIGAENRRGAAKALGNLIFLSFLSVVLSMLIVFFLGRWIIAVMRVPAEAVGEAWNYMRTCSYGLIFVMGYSTVGSVLRTMGDSRAPFIFIVISSFLNIVFDYVTVGLWHMAATGAAISTVTSQGICFILSLLYIRKKGLTFPFSLRDCVPEKDTMLTILKVGIPISLQSTMNNVSFMISGAMINTMGLYVSAASSVIGSVTSFCLMIPMSLQASIATMTAQNIGARKPERAVRSLWYGVGISLIFAVPFCIVCALWPEAIAGILNKDPKVLVESVRYLYPMSWDAIFVSFVFCFNGFFNGCGKTLFAMLQETLSAFLVRIPVTWLMLHLLKEPTIFYVGMGAPLASLASMIACIIYYRARFSRSQLENMKLLQEG